ncbi:hypothetical protein ACVWXS_005379 [Lysinibacillus sp. TE18511]
MPQDIEQKNAEQLHRNFKKGVAGQVLLTDITY